MRYKGVKGKCWDVIKKITRLKWKDCYTCPAKNLTGINAQAGHCWPVGLVGSNNTLSWDLRQIRLQCSRCNGPGQGMQSIFKARLEKELGKKVVAQLESRVHKLDPIKDWDELLNNLNETLKAQNNPDLED